MKAATAAHLSYSKNHNSHKHNWNFIECKTTGSKIQFLKGSTSGGEVEFTFSQSCKKDIRSFLPSLFSLCAGFPLSSFSPSRSVGYGEALCFVFFFISHAKTCTLLPADAANACLQPASSERKQQEEACIVKNRNRWR